MRLLGDVCLHEMLLQISGFILRRDMEYPSLTLQVMRHSFSWTGEEEAEYMLRISPVIRALALAIRKARRGCYARDCASYDQCVSDDIYPVLPHHSAAWNDSAGGAGLLAAHASAH